MCTITQLQQHEDKEQHHMLSTPAKGAPAHQLVVGSQCPSFQPAPQCLSAGNQPPLGPEILVEEI